MPRVVFSESFNLLRILGFFFHRCARAKYPVIRWMRTGNDPRGLPTLLQTWPCILWFMAHLAIWSWRRMYCVAAQIGSLSYGKGFFTVFHILHRSFDPVHGNLSVLQDINKTGAAATHWSDKPWGSSQIPSSIPFSLFLVDCQDSGIPGPYFSYLSYEK